MGKVLEGGREERKRREEVSSIGKYIYCIRGDGTYRTLDREKHRKKYPVEFYYPPAPVRQRVGVETFIRAGLFFCEGDANPHEIYLEESLWCKYADMDKENHGAYGIGSFIDHEMSMKVQEVIRNEEEETNNP